MILVILLLSGCLESADEQPDDFPDMYGANESSERSGMSQGVASESIPMRELIVSSPAFENGDLIPEKYTCDGENINPPLEVGNVSGEIVSLLLIMDDPDAPLGTFTHWVVWNIDPKVSIAENSIPGIEGSNGAGKTSYTGPCPPSGSHRYFFKFYALDIELDIDSGSDRDIVENAMYGHVIAYGELVGKYSRS